MISNNHGPKEFEAFTYLDYHNPTVSWNIARGAFCSPSELPPNEANSSFMSVAMAGMLSNTSPKRLYSELAIDSVRATLFPNCVSRLQGFFVFDEIESIARFWDCNSWGGHFSDDYLSDVGVSSKRSTRVDSNWISLIVDENGSLKNDWENNTICYWKGEVCPGLEPIWERIIEGWLTVWSSDVRKNACLEINTIWPHSFKLLQYASLCSAYGSTDGMILPFMMGGDNNNIEIIYLTKMAHADDSKFIDEIIKNAKSKPSIEIIPPHTQTDSDIIKLPDLTNFNISLSTDDTCAFSDFVKTINNQSNTENKNT